MSIWLDFLSICQWGELTVQVLHLPAQVTG